MRPEGEAAAVATRAARGMATYVYARVGTTRRVKRQLEHLQRDVEVVTVRADGAGGSGGGARLGTARAGAVRGVMVVVGGLGEVLVRSGRRRVLHLRDVRRETGEGGAPGDDVPCEDTKRLKINVSLQEKGGRGGRPVTGEGGNGTDAATVASAIGHLGVEEVTALAGKAGRARYGTVSTWRDRVLREAQSKAPMGRPELQWRYGDG